MSSRLHALKSWASHLQNAFVRDQNHLQWAQFAFNKGKQRNTKRLEQTLIVRSKCFVWKQKKQQKRFLSVFVFQKTSSSWKRFRSVFVWKNAQCLKLLFFGKYLKLPHFGKCLKLPYFVKCNQLFHFFEISTTCRHFWLFHKCNFHKVSYSNGWKEVSSLMSKPFANDICKLQSH